MSIDILNTLDEPFPTSEDSQETFDTKADKSFPQLNAFQTQMNTIIGQINSTSTTVTNNKDLAETAANVALSASNFKGDWSTLTGSATASGGFAVYHSNTFWMLLQDLADITTKEPGAVGSEAYWAEIDLTANLQGGVDTSADTGNVTLTATMKRVQYRSQSTSGKFYTLPAASNFNEGMGAAVFYNTGDYRFGIKDTDGNFICSVAPDNCAVLDLIDDTASAEIWKARESADLLMPWLKTTLNSQNSQIPNSCKLTSTEIFIAWQDPPTSDGFCAVLTWVPGTPAITISNILEFDTTYADKISCTRLSDTEVCICYQDTDSDGWAKVLTYNGTDTLTESGSYEFEVTAVGYLNCIAFSSSKIGVFYYDAGDLKGQVLDWNGSSLTSDTAESASLGTISGDIRLTLLSGSDSSASVIVGALNSTTFTIYLISWNGSSISATASATGAQYAPRVGQLVALDSDYFLSFHEDIYSNQIAETLVDLWYSNGSTLSRKRSLLLYAAKNKSYMTSFPAFLIDSSHVGLYLRTDVNVTSAKLFKLKVKGSTNSEECELEIETEMNVSNYDGEYVSISALDSQNAIKIFDDDTNSNYLTAEKIEIG